MGIRKDLFKEDKLYIHFGLDHFDKEKFKKVKNRKLGLKPQYGLWGSPVETERSWKQWCEENDFRECRADNCFYFRINSLQVYEIKNKEDFNGLPCKTQPGIFENVYPDAKCINFEALQQGGCSALDITIKDIDEYLPGYDCDCILVLDDRDLVVNYDAKITDKPLTLRQLLPMVWYKTICENIELSALCKMPDGKQYVYCEQPDEHYVFKTIVACITDGRIVETCGYSKMEAEEIIKEVLKEKDNLCEIILDNKYK